MKRIDTSIEGFEYIGIHLTEKQYEKLCFLNMVMQGKDREDIPVFNMMILLKILGLLPEEMICDNSGNNGNNDADNSNKNLLEREFGKIKE